MVGSRESLRELEQARNKRALGFLCLPVIELSARRVPTGTVLAGNVHFDHSAVRVAEVHRMNAAVVGDATGIDAGSGTGLEHLVERRNVDFKRNVGVKVVLFAELKGMIRFLEESKVAVVRCAEGLFRGAFI